jgi:hypothetical protein
LDSAASSLLEPPISKLSSPEPCAAAPTVVPRREIEVGNGELGRMVGFRDADAACLRVEGANGLGRNALHGENSFRLMG